MSEPRRARNIDRRPPIRKARPTRKSASGPGDRVASARDVAIYIREDCRTLRDSLQLEMVVAQYCLRIRDLRTTAGVPVGNPVGANLVAELEREGDPLSHAILRGVARVGLGETAKRSAEAVARLSERAIGLPPAFADVGQARALGAWRVRGDVDGEYALFAEFEHAHGARHTLALYVDPRRGGVVKHLGLLGSMSQIDAAEPFHPEAMESVELPVAGALTREVLGRSYGPSMAGSDDYRVLIAAARAESSGMTASSVKAAAAETGMQIGDRRSDP